MLPHNPLASCSLINLDLLLLQTAHVDEEIVFPSLVCKTFGSKHSYSEYSFKEIQFFEYVISSSLNFLINKIILLYVFLSVNNQVLFIYFLLLHSVLHNLFFLINDLVFFYLIFLKNPLKNNVVFLLHLVFLKNHPVVNAHNYLKSTINAFKIKFICSICTIF